ncbi:MAG: PocR ligand-binding domain-containing protein [Ignavibacteriota bacterium]
MDPAIWGEVLETYAATTKLAVALTDKQGRMVGSCHNPQALWRMAQKAAGEAESGCSFCLSPAAPCTAVVDAIKTGGVVVARDGAGLAHVAVPLSLGGRHWGALIAGQVFTRYPEPLPLQRVARDYGISSQQFWHQATRQVPFTQATLEVFGNLLMSLGDAYLGQRYAAILQRNLSATNLRYRLLIDGVEDYALYTIDRGGRVVGWNKGAERMFGYTEGEILGQDSACLAIPEDIRKEVIPQTLQEADGRLGRIRGLAGAQRWGALLCKRSAGLAGARGRLRVRNPDPPM